MRAPEIYYSNSRVKRLRDMSVAEFPTRFLHVFPPACNIQRFLDYIGVLVEVSVCPGFTYLVSYTPRISVRKVVEGNYFREHVQRGML